MAKGGSYLIYEAAVANDLSRRSAEARRNTRALSAFGPLAIVVAFLLLSGCNAVNPLCGSARPVPVLSSLSATSITLAQLQQGFLLTLNGKEFVAASVVIVNGTTLTTTVTSSEELQVEIPTDLVTVPGALSVTVNTPAGNSAYEGCTSGGTSSALTLTIT